MSLCKQDELIIVMGRKFEKRVKNAMRFFDKNNTKYTLKSTYDMGFEDIKYILDTVSLNIYDDEKRDLQEIIVSSIDSTMYKKTLDLIRELKTKKVSYDELLKLLNSNRELMQFPIIIKNDIAHVGFEKYECQQFLIGGIRNDPKWYNMKIY